MLTIIEARVIGCLLEKERTTPDQYPLSSNALVLACNQSTAREPVMVVDADDVDQAITSLKTAGLARLVHPSHGRSVTRFRQVIDEHHGWAAPESALMAVLLLRGPQTLAELKSRTERQHAFTSLDEVESTLSALAAREPAMVIHLERQPGHKETRWRQVIADEVEGVARPAAIAPAGGRVDALDGRVAELEARVARLEAALAELL